MRLSKAITGIETGECDQESANTVKLYAQALRINSGDEKLAHDALLPLSEEFPLIIRNGHILGVAIKIILGISRVPVQDVSVCISGG